jgi:Leucine-rich repeat (LRR) protein
MALIAEGVDTSGDGQISQAEAEAVTELDVSQDTISDMSGLEHFIHLQHLDCSGNLVLDSLDVSGLTELVSLRCHLNSLKNLDVSGNTQLRVLNCSSNVISHLDLSQNPLLDSIDCQGNILEGLDLSGNPELLWLNCGGNLFSTLDLSGNTTLKSLLCTGGLLTSLDVSENTALELLNCEDNLLENLDVSSNTALTRLGCAENHLTALDLTNNLALEFLGCSMNPVNHLDISNNVALQSLGCSGMKLNELDLSNHPALVYLFCSFNGLEELDLSQNLSLEMLWCEGNKLKRLDLSNHQMMKHLIVPNMPSLYEVCVWEHFADSVEIRQDDSPNVYFTTDCIYNNDSIVVIPDTIFLEALISLGTDLNGDGLISRMEAEAFTRLDLTAMGQEDVIRDMTGIGAFIYLDTLNCDQHGFTELDVSSLTYLAYLNCSGGFSEIAGCSGKLQSLDLSDNTMLEVLKCSCNPMTHLDLSQNTVLTDLELRQMPSLKDVRVWTLPFPSAGVTIDTTGSPNLHFTLDSLDNHVKIPDINFLYALIDQGVDTDGNGMISSQEADQCERLDVHSSEISDLTGIEHFLHLERLNCGDNEITDLNLSSLTDLSALFCSSNDLNQLDLTQNRGLIRLECGSNPLKILDLSENTLLDSLKMVSNYSIRKLDLSGNTALSYLLCAYTGLSTLDVSSNTELSDLTIAASGLRHLDLSNNNKLEELSCSLSLLNELDLSHNPELTTLFCNGNYLSELDLSSNPLLRTVYCHDNRLSELDVSVQAQLVQLYCSFNRLSTLDLSYNPEMEELDCSSNDLTNLDLSNNQALTLLHLNNMPSLTEVCVWESFPANIHDLEHEGSPHLCFETDCNGICDQTAIETFNAPDINIFPNPVQHFLTIEAYSPGLYTIEITSLSGQVLYSRQMLGSSCQLDLTGFRRGIYFITLRTRDLVTTRKIIKL